MEVLQRASKFARQLQGVEVSPDILNAIVDPVLVSAEEATLRKVGRTWLELCEWAGQKAVCVVDLSAVQVAQFVMDSPAASRVLPALCFMRKRLHLAIDLDLALAFRTAKSGALGHGAKQAPVAQRLCSCWNSRLQLPTATAIRTG